MRIGVTLEGSEELMDILAAIGKRAADVIEPAALAGGSVIEDEVERRAPGPYIEKEVTKRTKDRVEVSIGVEKKHWTMIFFETGAVPHEIKAKHAKLLAFLGRAGLVLSKKVQHTGMAASPYMRPGIEAAAEEATLATGAKFAEAIESLEKE